MAKDSLMNDRRPGNTYEAWLWQLAGGPVPRWRMFGGWVLLGVLAHVIAYWAGWVLDPFDNRVLPAVSIPYWLGLCPLWARSLGRRHPPTRRES